MYGATLLYWLRDYSIDDEDTLAFLDRRLAGVGRIGKARRHADEFMQRMRRNRHRTNRPEAATLPWPGLPCVAPFLG